MSTSYASYKESVENRESRISCVICKVPLLCKEFKTHLLNLHCEKYPSPKSCEWCLGSYKFPEEKKSSDVVPEHLQRCFSSYCDRNSDLSAVTESQISHYESEISRLSNEIDEMENEKEEQERKMSDLERRLYREYGIELFDTLCGGYLINGFSHYGPDDSSSDSED